MPPLSGLFGIEETTCRLLPKNHCPKGSLLTSVNNWGKRWTSLSQRSLEGKDRVTLGVLRHLTRTWCSSYVRPGRGDALYFPRDGTRHRSPLVSWVWNDVQDAVHEGEIVSEESRPERYYTPSELGQKRGYLWSLRVLFDFNYTVLPG